MDSQTMKEGKSERLLLILHYRVKYNKNGSGFWRANYFFRWGFLPVYGDDEYLSICEMPIEEVRNIIISSHLLENNNIYQ